jgi:Exostosin family
MKKKALNKIFITTAYEDLEPVTSMREAAFLSKNKKYEMVDNPDISDIIFFVENSHYNYDRFFRKLKNHPLIKKYPQKVFMYNPHDKPWLVLPGLYASLPKFFFDEEFIAAVPYIENINSFIKYEPRIVPEFLFSFIGSPNSSARRTILKLNYKRCFVSASLNKMFSNEDLTDVKLKYANILTQSKYVLCPRGAGTSSFRLFETMQAGRIPVIISDGWVPPIGPSWNTFALFISEKNIHLIPQILEEDEPNWLHKSELSRKTWELFFAPDVIFNYFIDNIMLLPKNYSDLRTKDRLSQSVPFIKYAFRVFVLQKIKSFSFKIRNFKKSNSI